MVQRILCEVEEGSRGLAGSVMRYGLVERLDRTARRAGVVVLAFGIGERALRIVVEGGREAIANLLRGVKVGTVRAARGWGRALAWRPCPRWEVPGYELEEAVAWAHRAGLEGSAGARLERVDPLATPWSSHRDLLGYRRARFYDPEPLRRRVDPERVHQLAGGRPLPDRRVGRARRREPLALLLRVAAAIRGVLPADRRCFRLFVHLARARGWRTVDLAEALMLTGRRIRQLAEGREPLLRTAITSLQDPRLCRVP